MANSATATEGNLATPAGIQGRPQGQLEAIGLLAVATGSPTIGLQRRIDPPLGTAPTRCADSAAVPMPEAVAVVCSGVTKPADLRNARPTAGGPVWAVEVAGLVGEAEEEVEEVAAAEVVEAEVVEAEVVAAEEAEADGAKSERKSM
jgi:hypothetical protein